MHHASVTLHSPEHEVLKQVLVLQRVTETLLVSFERIGSTLVGTHAMVGGTDAERALSRLHIVAEDWQQVSAS